jgi:hypothetical protein
VDNVNLGHVASPVDLTVFGVLPGDHVLAFYAVNDLGFISDSATESVQVIAAATRTPARSDTLTQSPPPSQTAPPWPSAYQ